MAVTINGTTGIVTPDIGVDGTTLVIDSVNDRIGIGTASPDQYLDVESNSNTSARITAHGYICRDNWGSQTGMRAFWIPQMFVIISRLVVYVRGFCADFIRVCDFG